MAAFKLHDVGCGCWYCRLELFWFIHAKKSYKIYEHIMLRIRQEIYEITWRFK